MAEEKTVIGKVGKIDPKPYTRDGEDKIMLRVQIGSIWLSDFDSGHQTTFLKLQSTGTTVKATYTETPGKEGKPPNLNLKSFEETTASPQTFPGGGGGGAREYREDPIKRVSIEAQHAFDIAKDIYVANATTHGTQITVDAVIKDAKKIFDETRKWVTASSGEVKTAPKEVEKPKPKKEDGNGGAQIIDPEEQKAFVAAKKAHGLDDKQLFEILGVAHMGEWAKQHTLAEATEKIKKLFEQPEDPPIGDTPIGKDVPVGEEDLPF